VWAIASLGRKRWIELAWAVFVAANLMVVARLANWQVVPALAVWVSLTLVFGVRLWSLRRLADTQRLLLDRQRDFVSDASHQLRTPITIARGHAELIREAVIEGRAPDTVDDIDILLDELGRLSRLSERLLVLTAADHSRFLSTAPVDVSSFIRECGQRWERAASRLWVFDAQASGSVPADEERLVMAVDALIENAVKFTEDGDGIAVRATVVDDTWLVIEVVDTGVGIASEDLDRVFERFARGGARTRFSGGTGLGLAIVRAIAEAHAGSVVVESASRRGSTFRIMLPGFQPALSPRVPSSQDQKMASSGRNGTLQRSNR
jgi:signal transduction histidine kinase